MRALIEAGADVNKENGVGYTPLHMAAAYGWNDCVPVLLKAGANRSLVSGQGLTALQVATGNASMKFEGEPAAACVAPTDDGMTPLRYAAAEGPRGGGAGAYRGWRGEQDGTYY